MLVLSRKVNERINIGADIQVVVLAVEGSRVRLGLVAPRETPIRRQELPRQPEWVVPQEPAGVTG